MDLIANTKVNKSVNIHVENDANDVDVYVNGEIVAFFRESADNEDKIQLHIVPAPTYMVVDEDNYPTIERW